MKVTHSFKAVMLNNQLGKAASTELDKFKPGLGRTNFFVVSYFCL